MPANKAAINFQSKGREGNTKPSASTTTRTPRSKSNAYKEHALGCERASSSEVRVRKIANTDWVVSASKAGSRGRGTSHNHVDEKLSPAPGTKSQSTKRTCGHGERISSGETGFWSALTPRKRKSARPGSQYQPTPSKEGTPVKERLQAWGSGTKDWVKSKKSQNGIKSVYDMAVLEDREGKNPAPQLPQRWIKFTLSLPEDGRGEFIRLSNDLGYTWDEAHEYAVALSGYICSAAPPHKGYERQKFMVIFHIANWSTTMIEMPAQHCMGIVRPLEGHADLSVNVEFDEASDPELAKPERQQAVKEMLERAILHVAADNLKRKA